VRKAVFASCPKAVVEDVQEYLADTVAGLFEDEGTNPDAFLEALTEFTVPFFEGCDVSPSDATAFCKLVQLAAFPANKSRVNGKTSAHAPAAADKETLCRLPDLLMMYGGSSTPLLKNTTLEIVKGHLYGIVGANGTGKSTLMNKIARKDIVGFPESIHVVHLSPDEFLKGIDETTTVRGHAKLLSDSNIATKDDLDNAISGVGFNEEMLGRTVVALSGGWQMRLALACAVAQKANLLLLDEPTNHLDYDGVQWLVKFLANTCIQGIGGGAAMIISHEPLFLDQVCTDIIHFTSDGRLAYHAGNFSAFKTKVLNGDQAEADRLLEINNRAQDKGCTVSEEMQFPVPEKIGATAAARKAPVITLQGGSFCYEAGKHILSNVDVKLSLESRVAIVGANGAGKSTLLALLADRLKLGGGELWQNKSMRLAYIAQSHIVHLGENLSNTPVEYMQERFRCGYDSTTPEKEARALTESEEADRKRSGMQFGKKSKPVQALLGRKEIVTGKAGAKDYEYLVQWEGLGVAERSWEGRGKLNQCGASAMADDLDERLWYAWAGVEQRSTSEAEIVKHLAQFGLSEEMVRLRKISTLSSGQKVKLMFGAALWTKPHVLCLDEPTNFLDVESVAMLQQALKNFRGGYAVVTHNQDFVKDVCNETWTISDGQVSGAKQIWGKAKNR